LHCCTQKFQRLSRVGPRNRSEIGLRTISMPAIVENFACTDAIFEAAATKKQQIPRRGRGPGPGRNRDPTEILWRPTGFLHCCTQKFQRLSRVGPRNRSEIGLRTVSMPAIVENFACTAAIFGVAATKKQQIPRRGRGPSPGRNGDPTEILWRPTGFLHCCTQKFQRLSRVGPRNRPEIGLRTVSMPAIVENFACTAAIFGAAATKKQQIPRRGLNPARVEIGIRRKFCGGRRFFCTAARKNSNVYRGSGREIAPKSASGPYQCPQSLKILRAPPRYSGWPPQKNSRSRAGAGTIHSCNPDNL
jgi:hypothetical protein